MGKTKIKQIDPSQIRYTPAEGEVIKNMEGEYLIRKDGAWMKFNVEGTDLNIGLYDINKQIISQLPDLDNLDDKELMINDFHKTYNNTFYMMYGKEISYFTLFKMGVAEFFGKEVVDCLKSVGVIKAIDPVEEGNAIEIWVQNEDGPTCLYLFPYDMGIVEVGVF